MNPPLPEMTPEPVPNPRPDASTRVPADTVEAALDPSLPPAPHPPCKRVIAVLTLAPVWGEDLLATVQKTFGTVDYRGPLIPFDDSDYYAVEMGTPLWRGWLSLRGLANPGDLPAWKQAARTLETLRSRDGRRTCNLDIGYLDTGKLVLASFKAGPFKLYLGRGVWADMILGYSGGAFTPLPWAFPDFRDGRYDKSLGVIREKLKAEMRQ
jgi:hypothetical protein